MSENGALVKVGAAVGAALTAYDPRSAVAARSLDDVRRMAQAIAKSGLYGCQSVEEAEIRMVVGMELGLSAMQSIRGVYVISTGGKRLPGLYADAMVGICKAHPDVCEYFRLVESTATKATYATKRIGEPGETVMSFTIEDARAAGLATKDPWKCYPAAMLRARAGSALARAVYPDLLNGLYSTEELQDMRESPQPVHVSSITADGEVVGDVVEQVQGVVDEAKGELFQQLLTALLDARSAEALDRAMADVGANRERLDKEHLDKLRQAAKEVKQALVPA